MNTKKNNDKIKKRAGINFRLRRSRRVKAVRLTVYCDGSVIVTSPFNYPSFLIQEFVRNKAEWIRGRLDRFKKAGIVLIKSKRGDYAKYKEEARSVILSRIEIQNRHYGFEFKKVFIKRQKRIWGSCSRKGNLNFNYKILFLPEEVRDYVVVHELCHLKAFDHSKEFWDLVSQTIPGHKDIRRRLRRIR